MRAIRAVCLSIFNVCDVIVTTPAESAAHCGSQPGDGMSDSWLNQFEAALQKLEAAVSSDQSDCARVMHTAAEAINQLMTQGLVRFWLQSYRVLNGQQDNPVTELLWGSSTDETEKSVTSLLTEMVNDQQLCASSDQFLIMRRQLSVTVHFFVQIADPIPICPRDSFDEGVAAAAEVVCTSVARLLVARYEQRLDTQFLLTKFIATLGSCLDTATAARIIAHDGPPLFGNCRISVFQQAPGGPEILSVTGVQKPGGQSATLRALHTLTSMNPANEWIDVASLTNHDLSALEEQSVQFFYVTVVRLTDSREVAHVVIELFEEQVIPEEIIVHQFRTAVEDTLIRLFRARKGWRSIVFAGGRLKWVISAVAVMILLTIIPADFEVEVPGRVSSQDHQRIFAPDNGIVETVHFQNEQHVGEEHPLILLSNPDLALEERRLLGEIDTTRAEQTAVRSRLLTEDDPVLSAQAERLAQQLRSLEGQLALLQERLTDMQLDAPVAGRVYRLDPRQELRHRPVVRGQLLMELIPDNSEWELALQIPSHLEHYVRSAAANSDGLPLRFTLAAEPGSEWKSTLTEIDHAVQLYGEDMTCHATAGTGNLTESHLRPGTSVTARIYCGQRALGFVWFRELIELGQQVRFSWF